MIIKTHKNTLTAYGTIFSGDGRYFVEELTHLEQNYAEIVVRLHTSGGSVFDGNLIYNALNKSASAIHIIIDGIAASMGAIIILSAKKVSIVENGYIMIHAPSSYSNGQAQDFENQAKLLRSIERNFVEKLVARTKKSVKEVEKWLVGDNWFDAQEAQKLGLVTDIIPSQMATLFPIQNPSQMAEQDVYNAYACLFASLNVSNSKLNNKMKSSLIQALSLASVTTESSDTAVVQAIQERLEQEKQAREKAEKELQTFKKAQIEAVLSVAIKEKKIAENQKEVYQKIAETSGIEALNVVLENTKGKAIIDKAPNLSQIIQGKTATQNPSWSFDQWQENDPKGLERMSVEDPEQFQALFQKKYGK